MRQAQAGVGVIGAGAWGTALAIVLGGRGVPVDLWARDPGQAEALARTRENALHLPGAMLPPSVRVTASLAEAVAGKGWVVLVTPSQALRDVLKRSAPSLPPATILISGAKGIEVGSLLTMSQVIRDVLGPAVEGRIAVASGPSFAQEVVRGMPTTIVAAADRESAARDAQRLLSGPALRVYAATDLLGVELGGALKNVIAIAAGVVDGLGLGTNARAGLITRGLAEMARLGTAMGARASTFAGLSGLGDLVLTCTGDLSRNRRLGIALAKGARLDDLLTSRMVAEGVETTRSALALARRYRVEMPIAEQVHAVLFEGKSPRDAAADLMARDVRFEET